MGFAELVTLRSACVAVATTTVAVAELLLGLGSVVLDATLAVSVIVVPAGVVTGTFRTTVNVAEAPAAKVGFEHDNVPLTTPQVHPVTGDGVTETNVVFAGMGSLKTTELAEPTPLFVTTTESVMLEPATTGLGAAVLVMDRSAVLAKPTVV